MEIPEIKARLSLKEVLEHYGLKPDKQARLQCPFHPDRTPSLQVYYKTQSCYCFSSNCPTHGKSLDVIDFILYKEQLSKREAILKAKAMISGEVSPAAQLTRVAVLTKMFTYFKNAIYNSKPAQDYLQQRGLDYQKTEVGYNSGQFHHGTRKNEALIQSCVRLGLLTDRGRASRTGGKAYIPFGKGGIVFPLKNQQHQIVSLYFRSITDEKAKRHFYLKDRQGLYPAYPEAAATKLILTESIIDAATLLQQKAITQEYSILALYGTNGLTEEHRKAIKDVAHLQEVIFFLNGDEAGREAVVQHSQTIQELLPGMKISNVEVPEGEDVNSLLQSHEPSVLTHLLEQRTVCRPTDFFLSPESVESTEQVPPVAQSLSKEKKEPASPTPDTPTNTAPALDTRNPHFLIFRTATASYYVKGGVRSELDSLRVSLDIEHPTTKRKHRSKPDLYEDKQVGKVASEAGDKLDLRADLLILDMERLTDLLEAYRREQLQPKEEVSPAVVVPSAVAQKCIGFLSAPNVLPRLNEMIGQAGVVGEELNRLFLFVIATSYKMPHTLHALIQGSSGSGKTHLLIKISALIPDEDVKRFTRVTDSSFYNYGQYELQNKLICLEDFDGMREEAQLAFRELQSREMLSSSTSGKDEQGNIRSYERVVYGPIASLCCTTRGQIYEDNMGRCFLIAVDETSDQTHRIIRFQNHKASGKVNSQAQAQATEFIQHCLRMLKPYEVINPYADQVSLPPQAHKIRRLNELYQSFVGQVTLLNQYRRKQDSQGRLISEKEDLQIAADIMFESILLKVDELDGSLRHFYERLKQYVQAQGGSHSDSYAFTQREIRQALHVSKSGLHRFLRTLLQLEYIRPVGGYANKGYQYQITYWDNVAALRANVKRHLQGQLNQLELITA
jgi:DNA primase catalytic core